MVYRKHPNQRRFLPIPNQSQVNPKAALAAWAGRHGPKASPLITLLTRPRSLIVSHCTFRLDLNSVNTEEGSPLVKISAYCDEVGI